VKRQFNSTDVTLFGPVVQRIERVTSNLQIQVRFLVSLRLMLQSYNGYYSCFVTRELQFDSALKLNKGLFLQISSDNKLVLVTCFREFKPLKFNPVFIP
jgi:hypothetical protein